MAIQITCSGCYTRFEVSDKFAGKKGPCPKCKAIIQVPNKKQEVVIHEPEHSEEGARGTTGELILKPIEREEAKFQPMFLVGVAGVAILALLIALILRGAEDKTVMLYVGAIALAPPLVWSGYLFLRDPELLAGFTGISLWIRTAICSACYAGLWALFSYFYYLFIGEGPAEYVYVLALSPPFLFLGAGTALCCFDFDLGTGFFHYSLYLSVTILLRVTMGLPAVGPAPKPPAPEVSEEATVFLWNIIQEVATTLV